MVQSTTEVHNYISTISVLLVSFACTFFVWYAKFHWDRRRLYKIASTVPGPRAYPVLGSALNFVGNSTTTFNNFMKILETYQPLGKVWLVHELFYVTAKPEHYEIILNDPNCLGKTSFYEFLHPFVGTGLLTAPVEKWKRTRKLINPAFHSRVLESFVCVFAEQSNTLTDTLREYTGRTFDVFHVLSTFSLNIICETALGVKFKSKAENSEYAEWVDQVAKVTFLRMFQIWYYSDFIFNRSPLGKRFYENLTKIHKFTNEVIVEKRRVFETRMEAVKSGLEVITEDDNKSRKAFLDLLLELSYEGEQLTDDELRQEVDTITATGSDTTAASTAFVFLMLAMHKDIQTKVFDELIDVLGYDRTVTAEDLPKLKYLERVVNETLRLFPIAPFVSKVVKADIQLEEYLLPAGCSVILGYLQTHRNALHWEDPLKFNPDRFLPEEVSKRHPYSYVPFSGGPRNCIGKRFALMNVKTMVATIVRKYKIKTTYKSVEDILVTSTLVLRPINGFNISLEERE